MEVYQSVANIVMPAPSRVRKNFRAVLGFGVASISLAIVLLLAQNSVLHPISAFSKLQSNLIKTTALSNMLNPAAKVPDLPYANDIPQTAQFGTLRNEPFTPQSKRDVMLVNKIIDAQPNVLFQQSYASPHGIQFNIYSSSVDTSSPSKHAINPQTLDFIANQYTRFLPNAPSNNTKSTMLTNMATIKKSPIIVNIIYEIGQSASCLVKNTRSEYIIVKNTGQICDAAGATITYDKSPSTPATLLIADNTFGYTSPINESADKLTDRQSASYAGNRTEILAHELGHALQFGDLSRSQNSYEEGDDKHEIITWLLNDAPKPNSYNFNGAKTNTPDMSQTIYDLTDAKLLPPLITKR